MTDIADRLIQQLNQHLGRALSAEHQADLHRATEGIETELSPLEIETLCNLDAIEKLDNFASSLQNGEFQRPAELIYWVIALFDKERADATAVMLQIQDYFGELSSQQRSHICSLSQDEAEDFAECMIDFETHEDLDSWLETTLVHKRQRLMEGIESSVGELSPQQQAAMGSLSRGAANALAKFWVRLESLDDLDRWLETNLADRQGRSNESLP